MDIQRYFFLTTGIFLMFYGVTMNYLTGFVPFWFELDLLCIAVGILCSTISVLVRR